MISIIEGAGVFIYPLGLCSLIGTFIFVERLIALRRNAVIPQHLLLGFTEGDLLETRGEAHSVAGRILRFHHEHKPDAEALKALVNLEIIRLERGMFLLESVISTAPLIGLLGTVTGLIQVFATHTEGLVAVDVQSYVPGIALALTTTMLGLLIAIPALVANAYLNRRIEMLAGQLHVGVERLIELARQRQATPPPIAE